MWCWKSLGSGIYWSTGDGCIWLKGQLNREGKLYGNSCLFSLRFSRLKKKKRNLYSQCQSTSGECFDWARVQRGICLFSPHGKVIVVGSWILLLHVTHRSVSLAVSSRGSFLPSSSDSKYRVIFNIFFLQVENPSIFWILATFNLLWVWNNSRGKILLLQCYNVLRDTLSHLCGDLT